MGRLNCELERLGMTALHRVGLAGLAMTLEAFEANPPAMVQLSSAGVSWERDDRYVVLSLEDGKEQEGLDCLLGLAFQLDNGFFKLPGLEREGQPTLEQRWLLYQALLGTFLQFGPHRPTGKKGELIVEIDDKRLRIPEFAPIKTYRHQSAGKDFLGRKGLRQRIGVVGWLYPGGSQRHVAYGSSTLEEPAELAFCLLFAPVGAIFFQIASRHRGRKARTTLVLPQVRSLQGYAELRRYVARHGVLALTAASPTDAALQLVVLAKGHGLADELGSQLRVLTFGIVAWNEKQKSRTATYTIAPTEIAGMRNYELANALFKNRWQLVKAQVDRKGKVKIPEHHFVRPFTAREIIADNVAAGRDWYSGFSDYLIDNETRVALQFERQELSQMT